MPVAKNRAALLDRYDDGARLVRTALAGATETDLDRRAGDGWTAREVVHHLADSEMTSALRLRRLLCEDAPVIAAYDEAEFARRLHYDVRPIEGSLAAFEAARRTSSDILRLAGPDEWIRSGTHSDTGPYSVDDWLATYAAHAHDHADQIRRALAGAPSQNSRGVDGSMPRNSS